MIHTYEVKPGLRFPVQKLEQWLPNAEAVLFFGKVYGLDAQQLGRVCNLVLHTDVVSALVGESGTHSHELQDYLVQLGYEDLLEQGEVALEPRPPHGELLPQVWADLEIEVAQSIKDVADKLKDVVGQMPGLQGEMVFDSMMKLNARRPTLGDYRAKIRHTHAPDNLVILDVSGSMTEHTVRRIVDEVVALSYMANAYLAIVSYTGRWWGPNEYDSDTVLKYAEFGGTHYEALAPLFNKDWGIVVTIADYDSSWAAKGVFQKVTGKVEQVLDISLVSSPTFLSEVIGTIAKDVRPLLVAADDSCCMYPEGDE